TIESVERGVPPAPRNLRLSARVPAALHQVAADAVRTDREAGATARSGARATHIRSESRARHAWRGHARAIRRVRAALQYEDEDDQEVNHPNEYRRPPGPGRATTGRDRVLHADAQGLSPRTH